MPNILASRVAAEDFIEVLRINQGHRDQQRSTVFPTNLRERPHGQPAPDRQILKVPAGAGSSPPTSPEGDDGLTDRASAGQTQPLTSH